MQQIVKLLQGRTFVILTPLVDDAAIFAFCEIARIAFPQVAFRLPEKTLDKGLSHRLYVGINTKVFSIDHDSGEVAAWRENTGVVHELIHQDGLCPRGILVVVVESQPVLAGKLLVFVNVVQLQFQ